MLTIPIEATVVSREVWGPFRDDPNYGTPEARTIPYAIVKAEGMDGLVNLTAEQGFASDAERWEGFPLLEPVRLLVELYADRSKLKARLVDVQKGGKG